MNLKSIGVVFGLSFLLSLIFTSILTPSYLNECYSLLLNSFSILLALIVAFIPLGFGFVPSIIKSFNDRVSNHNLDPEDARIRVISFTKEIDTFFNEIKHNTLLCMIAYFFVFTLFHLRGADIPWIHWPIESVWWLKSRVYYLLSLFAFTLSLYALWDTVMSCFTIISLYIQIDIEEDDCEQDVL